MTNDQVVDHFKDLSVNYFYYSSYLFYCIYILQFNNEKYYTFAIINNKDIIILVIY